ncbi:MAG: methylcobamide--CoM methyltransferase MtbA [Clostridiales bacterium]|nr:methylcobamide--CoM methyltransferase MtbA [Clostridiales bacterium]
MINATTSMDRVLTTLNHREPDKVPLFLPLSVYGAKELGMDIKKYFSDPKNVIEAQIRMTKKYNNDCYYGFFYAAIEFSAWGGEIIFPKDSPPTAGEPVLKRNAVPGTIKPPDVGDSKSLLRVLETIQGLKERIGNSAPIIGVVISPTSLPIMQMGFDNYFDTILERPDFFKSLIRANQEFCIQWANAQLNAGATAITYFDPFSSTSMVTKDMYNKMLHNIAKETLQRIREPIAFHLASGSCIPIIEGIIDSGPDVVGISCHEDIGQLKSICRDRVTLLGNLNGIEMCSWTRQDSEAAVKSIIKKAGAGGGLIISDNHGEIPLQVSEETLMAVGEAVNKWGRYPLTWTEVH